MMPLILTKPLRVLIIGAGRAGMIKARSALRYQQDVTLLSTEFTLCEQDNIDKPSLANELDEKLSKIHADFYQLSIDELQAWDLFYLAIPWPNDAVKQLFISNWSQAMVTRNKLVCVCCQPNLGNVVNPCSRQVNDYLLTLSGADMRPQKSVKLTSQLALQLALMLKDDVLHEKI